MKTTNNTVLITGGSAGIGFEIARLMLEKGNQVIITGRDEKRLSDAVAKLPGVHAIKGDVSNEQDADALVQKIRTDFPGTNMLINNAGRAQMYSLLSADANAYEHARDEMQTNYFAVVRLIEKFIPILRRQPEAAIVNVSSVVAFAPGRLVTYSASKAALHSYTMSLRMALEEETGIRVYELMPPLVNTELSKEIGGASGIHPSVVAEGLVSGLAGDEWEIHVGMTADFYKLFLQSPHEAARRMFNARKIAQ